MKFAVLLAAAALSPAVGAMGQVTLLSWERSASGEAGIGSVLAVPVNISDSFSVSNATTGPYAVNETAEVQSGTVNVAVNHSHQSMISSNEISFENVAVASHSNLPSMTNVTASFEQRFMVTFRVDSPVEFAISAMAMGRWWDGAADIFFYRGDELVYHASTWDVQSFSDTGTLQAGEYRFLTVAQLMNNVTNNTPSPLNTVEFNGSLTFIPAPGAGAAMMMLGLGMVGRRRR